MSLSLRPIEDEMIVIRDKSMALASRVESHLNWVMEQKFNNKGQTRKILNRMIYDLIGMSDNGKSNISIIRKLSARITSLEEENNRLKEKIESSDKIINSLSHVKTCGNEIVERIKAAGSLIKLLERYFGKDVRPAVVGSFPRKVFELIKVIGRDIKIESGYGDPIGHDIDIVIYNIEPGNIESQEKISKMMDKIQNYLTTHRLASDKISPLKLGIYNIVDIINITLTKSSVSDPIGKKNLLHVPHYLIKASDDNKNMITFDILGWKPSGSSWPVGDFDVNCLTLDTIGFSITGDYNFFDVINHIHTNEAECLIDLESYQNVLDRPVTRIEKIPGLSQLSFFFADRLKITSVGYSKITSAKYNVPAFEIEKNESCYITECNPPYVNLTFECGHKLSVMAYIGEIIKGGNEYSEKISCPQCRGVFKIRFNKVVPTYIEEPSLIIPVQYLKMTDGYTDEIKHSKSSMSVDAVEYIKKIYKDPEPINKRVVLEQDDYEPIEVVQMSDPLSSVRHGARSGHIGLS